MYERLKDTDFSSYLNVFQILQVAEKIYDAILYMKAYHFYGIPSCGYRYFSKTSKSKLTNDRPRIESKRKVEGMKEQEAKAHSTANEDAERLGSLETTHLHCSSNEKLRRLT